MSLPIISIPSTINKLLSEYSGFFTKPQFGNFRRLITGLIVSENKTLQKINDQFGKRNQSSLNRFVSNSKWDLDQLNSLRIKTVVSHLSLEKKGVLIIDESLNHKTGKHMELVP